MLQNIDLRQVSSTEGSLSDTFIIGTDSSSNKILQFGTENVNNPSIRYNTTTDEFEFSNNGVTFSSFGSGGGGGIFTATTGADGATITQYTQERVVFNYSANKTPAQQNESIRILENFFGTGHPILRTVIDSDRSGLTLISNMASVNGEHVGINYVALNEGSPDAFFIGGLRFYNIDFGNPNDFGTTSSSQVRIVGGSIHLHYGNSFTTGEKLRTTNIGVTITGDATANDFISTSDIRLKEDIKPLENSLEKIKQLNGVDFKFKDSEKRNIGLIAQNVEKVLPELVHEFDKDGELYKGVSYDKLVAVLIEAVKEQQVQIDELKKQINK
jgi:hypothetical protein